MASKFVMILFSVVFFEAVFCYDEIDERDQGICHEVVRTIKTVKKCTVGQIPHCKTKLKISSFDIKDCCPGWTFYDGRCSYNGYDPTLVTEEDIVTYTPAPISCSNCGATCNETACACINGTICILSPENTVPSTTTVGSTNTVSSTPTPICRDCGATCNDTACACVNGAIRISSTGGTTAAFTPLSLSLQLSWIIAGTLGILLLILVLVIIHRRRRHGGEFQQTV